MTTTAKLGTFLDTAPSNASPGLICSRPESTLRIQAWLRPWALPKSQESV
jgi:hypothetical protein